MKVNVLLFGQLTDIIGNDKLVLDDTVDTDSLIKSMQHLYPKLVHSKYIIAVDKKVISENTVLTNLCTVALLPPFSGG